MKKNTFKILFYLRSNQINKDGTAAIMCRIAVDGEYARLSTKLSVDPAIWNSKASKAEGRGAKINELNGRIDDMRVVIKEHYYDILQRHGYVPLCGKDTNDGLWYQ
ncbi:MAG: Arm DNA-binding domain-containing protein [Muribaculaceae bacterium]|nr:Arm DNA-binding domain-containing protein [Muribaculaceae bacterium]